MKHTTIVGVLLAVGLSGVTATAVQRAATCDRECLRGKVTQVLYAFIKHDVSGLPVAGTLRVTEDAVEKPLANVGLINSVTKLRGYRQDFIDERAGVVGAHVVVEEKGAPALLVVRLKVADDRLTEMELVATRNAAEGLIFNLDGLSAPTEMMNYAPRPEQLSSREDAIKAALYYPAGLNSATTFADVNAPFAANAYRYENVILYPWVEGYKLNEATTPEEPPPLGKTIQFQAKVPYRERVTVDEWEDMMLTVRLDWAGREQDSTKRRVAHLFTSVKPTP